MTGNEGQPSDRRFSTWTTRTWLRVGITVWLVVLTALGLTGGWVLSRTTAISGQLVDVSSVALTASGELELAVLNQETGIRGYALTGRTDFLDPYREGLGAQESSTARLSELLVDDAAGRAALAEAEEALEAWQEQTARPIAATAAGSSSPAAVERATRGKAAFDDLREAVGDLQRHLSDERDQMRRELQGAMALRNWIFTAIAVVVAALAALVFEGLRRGIKEPLERLGADARAVTGGDFAHAISPTGPADLARLADEFDVMRRRLVRELSFTEEARARLDAQTADLRRSNAELEQFAYVASHDLQEPLRKVSSFTQLLQRRYGGQLDDRADQYIGFAVDGANRMQTLINDLLDFSRVGRIHNALERVDLDKVLDGCLDSLSVSIEESGAEITRSPLPTVVADPTQLGMLWQNLIGNAVKFRRPGVAPRISVDARQEGSSWRFTVTDNGIGIAPEYAEKVFVIFQRLHTKDAYPGSGIGLAMCKKIVEFHGGTIAIDTGCTEGTRITFTLAQEPPTAEEFGSGAQDTPSTGTERAL
ncbi:CHASE3 domain-containing protein [Streptomyces sp. NPDC013457]|uniref:sensor histidine kinase n=1 Tax=Streptomyces sp. NPDC013457 TaxID=3364866 RepID=UPI0036FFEC68